MRHQMVNDLCFYKHVVESVVDLDLSFLFLRDFSNHAIAQADENHLLRSGRIQAESDVFLSRRFSRVH